MQLQNPFCAHFPRAKTMPKLTFSCKNLPVTKKKKPTNQEQKTYCPQSQQSSTLQDHLIYFQAAGLQQGKEVCNLLLC